MNNWKPKYIPASERSREQMRIALTQFRPSDPSILDFTAGETHNLPLLKSTLRRFRFGVKWGHYKAFFRGFKRGWQNNSLSSLKPHSGSMGWSVKTPIRKRLRLAWNLGIKWKNNQ